MKNLFKLIVAGLLIFPAAAFAQHTYMQSIGGSYCNGGSSSGIGVTWSPRLNLKDTTDRSFSIGTHATLGVSYNSTRHPSILFDLPVMAEWNYGNGASATYSRSFGYFFGAGLEMNIMNGPDKLYVPVGPAIDAGIRFMLKGTAPIGLRVSYLINVIPNNVPVFTFGISKNLGITPKGR